MNDLKGPFTTRGDLTDSKTGTASGGDCSRPLKGPDAAYIPNIVVSTHENRKAWFYDDLLLGKRVLISSVSTRDESSRAVMERLSKVQDLIGRGLGRHIFIYSITTDPENDTPRVLRLFAERYGAKDGWLFLTGEPAGIRLLRDRLFRQGGHDCSMSLLRYGNPSTGLWGGILATALPEAIAQRLSWMEEVEPISGHPRRRGPSPLNATE